MAHPFQPQDDHGLQAPMPWCVWEQHDQSGPRKTVAVIGAGCSGLIAALHLLKLGHDVEVLESSSRTGGRLLTVHLGGQHAEGGAMRIPTTHRATLSLAEELGVKMRPFVNHNTAAYLRINGTLTRLSDWAGGVPQPYFVGDDWTRNEPSQMWNKIMMELLAPLSDTELRAARTSDLGGHPQLIKLSEMSLRQAINRLPANYSATTVNLVGKATEMWHYMDHAALENVMEHRDGFAADMLEPVRGMEDFTERMVQQVGQRRVRLGSRVVAIEVLTDRVKVRWASVTGEHSKVYDYVICAVPAPAVAGIRFSPPLPNDQRNAFNGLSYAPASKSILYVKKRFHEVVDQIIGGRSLTDHPGIQVVYQSDNAISDEEVYLSTTLFPEPTLTSRMGTQPGGYKARSREVSEGPGMIVVYRWNTSAVRHMALSRQEQDEAALREVRSIHGSVVDDYVEVIEHVAWPTAFAHFRAGEHLAYQGPMEQPHPLAAPRIWFAGEHLRYLHGWIQPAIESGWQAALSVAAAPCPVHTDARGDTEG